MRRLLLGVLIGVITLAALLGGGLLLAKGDQEEQAAAPVETLPAVTEAPTLPPETEAPPETEPEKTVYDTVPLYYQTDYPYIQYGDGTMATSGCSVTCLAMIATYMTDQEYTPLQMAHHFRNSGKDHVQRLDAGIAAMQLPYQRTHDVRDVLAGLEEGKVAIAMMNEQSFFTNEQHFIVMAGINEAGKYVIHDPYETNYIRADSHLKDAYENGFEEYHLIQGFTGAWIFDKKDMPSDPFLFDASMPEQPESRYEGYILTEEDAHIIACYVWKEAGNEPADAQQAVAEVVLNRIVSPDYPNTVKEVIHKTEFSTVGSGMYRWDQKDENIWQAVEAAMYGPYILPEDICFYSAWEKGEEPWGQLGSFTFTKTR